MNEVSTTSEVLPSVPPPAAIAIAPVPLTTAPAPAPATPATGEVRVKRKYTKRAVTAAPVKAKRKYTKRAAKVAAPKKARAAKAAKAPKVKRVAGIKAQTQVPKAVMKFFKGEAKTQNVRVADVLRDILISFATRRGVEVEA